MGEPGHVLVQLYAGSVQSPDGILWRPPLDSKISKLSIATQKASFCRGFLAVVRSEMGGAGYHTRL